MLFHAIIYCVIWFSFPAFETTCAIIILPSFLKCKGVKSFQLQMKYWNLLVWSIVIISLYIVFNSPYFYFCGIIINYIDSIFDSICVFDEILTRRISYPREYIIFRRNTLSIEVLQYDLYIIPSIFYFEFNIIF